MALFLFTLKESIPYNSPFDVTCTYIFKEPFRIKQQRPLEETVRKKRIKYGGKMIVVFDLGLTSHNDGVHGIENT